jgi:hypothetical protein
VRNLSRTIFSLLSLYKVIARLTSHAAIRTRHPLRSDTIPVIIDHVRLNPSVSES